MLPRGCTDDITHPSQRNGECSQEALILVGVVDKITEKDRHFMPVLPAERSRQNAEQNPVSQRQQSDEKTLHGNSPFQRT